jgi:hypothetical protein
MSSLLSFHESANGFNGFYLLASADSGNIHKPAVQTLEKLACLVVHVWALLRQPPDGVGYPHQKDSGFRSERWDSKASERAAYRLRFLICVGNNVASHISS